MKQITSEKIKAYEDYLPVVRGKVVAAVFTLLIAAVMATSATFAWITFSVSPEVTGVDTSVVANGSLEIALANGTGSAPGRSAAGDSVGAGNSMRQANITWGNLVNLSDPSYGLSNVTLRPASLNENSLLSNPLSGVEYGEDGRASKMTGTTNFGYVYWGKEKEENDEAFLYDADSNHLGVRAISTLKYGNLGAGSQVQTLYRAAEDALNMAKNNYSVITNEKQDPGTRYINSIQGLMQAYAQSKVDGNLSDMDVTDYVPALYDMLLDLQKNVVAPTGESYLNLAKIYALTEADTESVKDVDTLCNLARADKLPSYIQLESLKQFAQDRYQVGVYLNHDSTTSLAHYRDIALTGEKVYWKNISSIINWIVDIGTCTVDGYNMSNLMGNATKIVGNQSHTAVIYSGALKRMEQRIGQNMKPTISISVKNVPMIGNVNLKNVAVKTDAKSPFDVNTDMATLLENNKDATFKGTDAMAEDTYALAIDLWVRTNAGPKRGEVGVTVNDEAAGISTTASDAVFLTLEGHLLTKTETVEVTMEVDGTEYQVYIAEYDSEKIDVYLKGGKYYEVQSHVGVEEFVLEHGIDTGAIKYTRKVETRTEVIGYEGANRVWSSDQMSEFSGDGTSTTQGSGSCYVFYADTPADQARFLDLLGAMRVAFIDSEGNKIGQATMDTENYYALNGRVTVPLVLDHSSATRLYTDKDGREIYGLMKLNRNEATRVTALMYLDGTRLTNNMVLASGDIQGTMNIQFASAEVTEVATTETLTEEDGSTSTVTNVEYREGSMSTAIRNPELMDKFISVSASANRTDFTEFDDRNPPQTTLTIQVDGVSPKAVTARFTRVISATQGTLQKAMTFSSAGGSNWTTTYAFESPGTYVLRSVFVDGTEYPLSEPVTVTIQGDKLKRVSCDAVSSGRSASVMTANSSYTTTVSLDFVTNKTIQHLTAAFEDENGRQVSAPLRADAQGLLWSGSITFPTSGVYTLKYYTVNGEYYEIEESMRLSLDLLLGLRTQTWITCDAQTLAELQAKNPRATATQFILEKPVTLQVSCRIYDNSGNPITGRGGVKLTYGRVGSTVKKLDSDMKWSSASGRYEGNFNVSEAGTYRFANVTVGENVITSAVNAPGIQAMPPADAYYYSSGTVAYQYTKGADGELVVNVAYSSAATKVEATVTNGTQTVTLVGVQGKELVNTAGDSITPWAFSVKEEGRWTVESITLYGVYYDKQYYDDENGVTIDLTGENITTKVVKDVHVTLNSGVGETFSGYFMDSHKVSNMSVTVADYEGQAIQGANVSNVSVTYRLNSSGVSLDTYGYTGDGLETVAVTGAGTKTSDTEYAIAALDFRYAGEYKQCEVSLTVDGRTYVAGSDGTILHVRQNGMLAGSFPHYEVTWIAPTVKITGINPSPSTTIQANIKSASDWVFVPTHNFISPDGFYGRFTSNNAKQSVCGNDYAESTWPKATLTLSNGGTNFTGASVTVANKATDGSHDFSAKFSFTPSSLSATGQIGGGGTVEGTSSVSRAAAGDQKFETLTMTYGGKTFTVKLSNMLEINGTETKIPTYSYDMSEFTSYGLTAPVGSQELPYVSNPILLPTVVDEYKTLVLDVAEPGELDSSKATTNTTTRIAYYNNRSEKDRCGNETKYYIPYTITTTVTKTPAVETHYDATSSFAGWTLIQVKHLDGSISLYNSGRTYTAGTTLNLGTATGNDYRAKPVYKEIGRVFSYDKTSNYVVTVVSVGAAGAETSTKPNGTEYASAALISALAGTTEGWED